MNDLFRVLWYFVRTRWGLRFQSREALERWQGRKMDEFLKKVVRSCRIYNDLPPRLDAFPVMGKKEYRANFAALNGCGISLEEAERIALSAEEGRDFSQTTAQQVTVGLSSGTSGSRGVFLVSSADRTRWAGMVLARALNGSSLARVINPLAEPLRIAFFLRADSNLYQTVASRRIDFRYFDLTTDLTGLLAGLQIFQPHILIAPATVLAEMTRNAELTIAPGQVISVAEVLDERDESAIASKFGVKVDQIYQATEGFLASTCKAGKLHLNEEYLHVQCEFLDDEMRRFHPLITDFSRESQWFVRYRLDDILVAGNSLCTCGRVSRVIEKIEGRADEVLYFPEPVFPDVMRQAIYSMADPPDLYRIEQDGTELRILLKHSSPALQNQLVDALRLMFVRLGIMPPLLTFPAWTDQPAGDKQRRIRCIRKVESSS